MSNFTHVVAYFESVVPAVAYNAVAIVPDGVFSRASGDGLYVPAGTQLVAAFGSVPIVGTAANPRMRLNAPSLLRTALPFVRPLASAPGDTDPNVMMLLDRPIGFPNNEVLSVEVAWQVADVMPVGVWGVLFFNNGFEPLPPGDAFWIRATATTAASAGEWSTLTNLAFDVTLPEGNWAITGFEHVCADPVAARVVCPGQSFRPGTLSVSNTQERTHAAFYDGQLGVFARFASFAPPSVEVLCSGASAYHEVYFRVVKL